MLHPSYRRPHLLALLVFALSLFGCTKPNPLDCSDGTCTDPAHPFCDVDGSFGGTEQSCVAVTCTPGSFAACRGDSALTCNAAGTSYDLTQCADGCDATAGCRLCQANQTVCTAGTLQTCDANGAITSSQTCPLGCFQDEPRCRDVNPSNDLASYLDMAATAPDLTLIDGDTLYVDTAMIAHGSGEPTAIPRAVLITAPNGGVPIRVLIANHVQITGHVQIRLQVQTLGPALAIVANDLISIDGVIGFGHSEYDEAPAPGSVAFAGCAGLPGTESNKPYPADSAGGGGGHATAGGDGGNVGGGQYPLHVAGGRGGSANGNPTLVPLRGGCAGGTDPAFPTYNGGGAVQLSSRTKIVLRDDAILDLNGHAGPQQGGYMPSSGGGAGGGILLEAPSLELGDAARLLVNGAGGTFVGGPLPTSLTAMPTPGQHCDSNSSTAFYCSNGGDGAAIGGPATNGGDTFYSDLSGSVVPSFVAGGGGGGLGYIRINTATANYTKASTTIESGVLTTGAIGTR